MSPYNSEMPPEDPFLDPPATTASQDHKSETHETTKETSTSYTDTHNTGASQPKTGATDQANSALQEPPRFASVYAVPSRPPLSTNEKPKFRRSQSKAYNNAQPEWYWKPTPSLPMIWVRDARLMNKDIVAQWDRSWRRYQDLQIPKKLEDIKNPRVNSVHGRRRLEEEYAKLDVETRMAKEVALARHRRFCLRCTDGTLDYHTDPIVYDSEPLMSKCTGS